MVAERRFRTPQEGAGPTFGAVADNAPRVACDSASGAASAGATADSFPRRWRSGAANPRRGTFTTYRKHNELAETRHAAAGTPKIGRMPDEGSDLSDRTVLGMTNLMNSPVGPSTEARPPSPTCAACRVRPPTALSRQARLDRDREALKMLRSPYRLVPARPGSSPGTRRARRPRGPASRRSGSSCSPTSATRRGR